MVRIKMYAHANRMSLIFPVNFRHFSGFDQNVDIVYTDGKGGSIWPVVISSGEYDGYGRHEQQHFGSLH
jgi:hypothetical protein